MTMEIPPEIWAERQRQIEVEGWTPEHDAEHEPGHLLRAAIYYLWHGDPVKGAPIEANGAPMGWPWEPSWWKPKDRRSNLIRAGALCLAERDAIVACQGNGHRGVAHVYQKLDIVIRELSAISSGQPTESDNG